MLKVQCNGPKIIWKAYIKLWYVIQAINQPLMDIKLPEANFPDELPLNPPSARRMQSFFNASTFLANYDMVIHTIKGDGNCLFRALSYLILGTEDCHQQVRLTLIDCNSDIFTTFCSPLCTLEEHTARMRYETVWGTDPEIKVAATYFQLPNLCVYTEKQHSHYWECFQPVLSNNLQSLVHPYFETSYINALHHSELYHSDRCHYDTVVMSDDFFTQNLENTVAHIDLTDSQYIIHSYHVNAWFCPFFVNYNTIRCDSQDTR